MFNNDMNNNGNFNNGNPIFGNNQNNMVNNQFDTQSSGVSFNPNFNNVGYNQATIVPNDMSDIPPELGEIRNLNDATISNAPTMDVLGPMNIMPDVLPQSNDLLDAYERGRINAQNNIDMKVNNSFPQQNHNTQNLNSNYPDNQPNLNSFNSNTNLTNTISPIMDINNTFQTQPLSSVSNSTASNIMENQTSYQTNSISTPNNLGYGLQNDLQGFNNSNAEPSLNTSLDNNYNLPGYEPISKGSDYPITSENGDYTSNEETPNNTDDNEDSSTTTSSSVLIPKESKEELKDTEKTDGFNNILNNDEPKELLGNKETNLEDLGIEADFSEPDTLEIMDIDNDYEKLSTEVNESLQEDNLMDPAPKSLVSNNVRKIKDLVNELKMAGADIQLEEFDFESMYQLIIKLNK